MEFFIAYPNVFITLIAIGSLMTLVSFAFAMKRLFDDCFVVISIPLTIWFEQQVLNLFP